MNIKWLSCEGWTGNPKIKDGDLVAYEIDIGGWSLKATVGDKAWEQGEFKYSSEAKDKKPSKPDPKAPTY